MKTNSDKNKSTFLTDTHYIKNKEKRENIIDKSPKRLVNIQQPIEEYIERKNNNFQIKDRDFKKVGN
jgi:hypothetical protein